MHQLEVLIAVQGFMHLHWAASNQEFYKKKHIKSRKIIFNDNEHKKTILNVTPILKPTHFEGTVFQMIS